MCNNCYGLSALVGCWSSVFIRKIIYQFFNVYPFDYTAFAVNWKVRIPLIGLSTWVTVVTTTDRPKSVRNRCVIEVFGGGFALSRCFLDFSVGVGDFVIGLGLISSVFSSYHFDWCSRIYSIHSEDTQPIRKTLDGDTHPSLLVSWNSMLVIFLYENTVIKFTIFFLDFRCWHHKSIANIKIYIS